MLSLDSDLTNTSVYSLFGFPIFTVSKTESVRKWIQEGAVDEDSYFGLRFLNHFYNPANPDPAARGYSYGLFSGRPSLVWGLEPDGPISGQDFSYRDAINYLYQGLTGPDETSRKNNLANLFLTIGHVTHLLEDLAQPQHTRNDSHGTGSVYEQFTNANRTSLNYDSYNSVIVTSPDMLWHTGDNKGMSDYSNRGFVTAGTNFTGTGTTILPNSPALPLPPDGNNASIVPRNISESALQDVLKMVPPVANAASLTGTIDFVSTPVVDNNVGQPEPNPMSSTYSIYDSDLIASGNSPTFTLNRFNYAAAQTFLIKRAVGYSAGLIDFLLRGKLEISLPAEKVYGIVDHSQNPTGFTLIKAHITNSTLNGDALSGGTLQLVAKFHTNDCYKPDLSGEFTEDASGNLVAPCNAYRSPAQGIAISDPITVTLASGGGNDYVFKFSGAPIPINATDLFFQAVYRGAIGQETDAVAFGTKDVAEPTYVTVFNATDQFCLNSAYYTPDNITKTPALFSQIDLNKDGVADVDYTSLTIDVGGGFISTDLVTVTGLQPAHFIRVAFITDDNVDYTMQFRGSSPFGFGQDVWSPITNQVDYSANVYYVSPLIKWRGSNAWNGWAFIRAQYPLSSPDCNIDFLPDARDASGNLIPPDSAQVNFAK